METKVCKICSIEKTLDNYRKSKEGKQGVVTTCKECEYGHKPHIKPTEEKVCPRCSILKPLSEYSIVNKEKLWYYSICKKCEFKQKEVNKMKTGYNRKKKLRDNYGLTLEDYNKMFNIQNGRCKICNTSLEDIKKKHLSIDHCHTTGKIRGLLCNNCNFILGFAKDNVEILQSAIKYLNDSKI